MEISNVQSKSIAFHCFSIVWQARDLLLHPMSEKEIQNEQPPQRLPSLDVERDRFVLIAFIYQYTTIKKKKKDEKRSTVRPPLHRRSLCRSPLNIVQIITVPQHEEVQVTAGSDEEMAS